jgi:hypothetical protein
MRHGSPRLDLRMPGTVLQQKTGHEALKATMPNIGIFTSDLRPRSSLAHSREGHCRERRAAPRCNTRPKPASTKAQPIQMSWSSVLASAVVVSAFAWQNSTPAKSPRRHLRRTRRLDRVFTNQRSNAGGKMTFPETPSLAPVLERSRMMQFAWMSGPVMTPCPSTTLRRAARLLWLSSSIEMGLPFSYGRCSPQLDEVAPPALDLAQRALDFYDERVVADQARARIRLRLSDECTKRHRRFSLVRRGFIAPQATVRLTPHESRWLALGPKVLLQLERVR